jgi:hypothetical protein
MLRVLAILMGIIQFSFAFHAMKTGNGPMWITIILVFPVVGCIAYYFMEVFPGTREQRQARAYYYDARPRQAEEILARLAKAHPKFRRDEVELLEALGDTDHALSIFERLRTTHVGFEAKCRYGELLMRLGRTAEARELFTVIVQNARRSALETEQEWVKLARRGLETGAA